MSKIVIGKSGNRNVALDVDALLRTRALVQANSGKGKSWLLRRIAEQLFGKIQVIIIDPEGEFATLREKFGYVLVGKGGETPADPRSAALVAHKLLELRASAVCDLYEMKPATRHEWVARFLDSMIDAPKNLWHPCVVMVDEAHVYCPEKGAGESQAAEAMIGLATRGRKRGFAALFATQRLGKLRKDAAAELLNVLIGGTFIDIDRKRAADALGVYGKDQHEFFDEIKVMERGTFFALGPAISNERILVKVGSVETTHPEAGSAKHAAEPPPAPEKVKAMLPKLADLPKTAEEKAKTEAELRREIRELKAALRNAPAQKPQAPIVDSRLIQRAKKETAVAFEKRLNNLRAIARELFKAVQFVARQAGDAAAKAIPELQKFDLDYSHLVDDLKKVSGAEIKTKGEVVETKEAPATHRREPQRPNHPLPNTNLGADAPQLKAGARKMLLILAQWHPEPKTRDELGALAGFAASGGTFGDYLSKLRLAGYVSENGQGVSITGEGLSTVGEIPDRPDSTEELLAMWKQKFKAGVGRMLEVLIEANGEFMTREDLGERSGFTASGGTFGDYLSQLRRARLIEESGGNVKAAKSMFP